MNIEYLWMSLRSAFFMFVFTWQLRRPSVDQRPVIPAKAGIQ
jgi:hypothetical protein